MDSFTIISLCAGAGGLELGVKLANPYARTVCYVEREVIACEVLAARMEDKILDEAPIWTDVRTFDGKPWHGKIHCITAGYPCQPFSRSGKHKGAGDPRHLWPDVARIIREVEPTYVFLENVSNHISFGFEEVRSELQKMGFDVEAGIFSAAEMGASHIRKRLFVLGHASGRPFWQRECEESCQNAAGGHAGSLGAGGQNAERFEEIFPPGPQDWASWERVIKDQPQDKPAFLDVDDELAAGMDESFFADRTARVHLLGNGVVPTVAAYAFCVLHSLAKS